MEKGTVSNAGQCWLMPRLGYFASEEVNAVTEEYYEEEVSSQDESIQRSISVYDVGNRASVGCQ